MMLPPLMLLFLLGGTYGNVIPGTEAHENATCSDAYSLNLYADVGSINGGRYECSGCGTDKGILICPCGFDFPAFRISCCKVNGRCQPCDPNTSCQRYKRCKRCHAGPFSEQETRVCTNCKQGWTLGREGDCTQSVDECGVDNGGCPYRCVNMQGTYECQCFDGFEVDYKTKECVERQCTSHGFLYGETTPTNGWMIESYIKYRCNNHRDMLQGNVARFCEINGMSPPRWTGAKPTCVDLCSKYRFPSSQNEPVFGPQGVGIDEETCLGRGLCYNKDTGKCHSTPSRPFVRLHNSVSMPGDVIKSFDLFTARSCSFECLTTEGCTFFAIEQMGYDEEHDVQHNRCLLYRGDMHDKTVDSTSGTAGPAYHTYLPLSLRKNEDPYHVHVSRIVDMHYEGCFRMPQHYNTILTDRLMTSSRCIYTCSVQGYSYAAIQFGTECYCEEVMRPDADSAEDCTIPCPGNDLQTCGGHVGASFYRIYHDPRYIGCFYDDGITDRASSVQYMAYTTKDKCAHFCATQGFKYVSLRDGGLCFCTDQFGDAAPEYVCQSVCVGFSSQFCGGLNASSIYTVHTTFDLSDQDQTNTAEHLHHCNCDNTEVTGITTSLFRHYPALKSVVSPNLVLRASIILAPSDTDTGVESKYVPCGEIDHITDITYMGKDVTLRFFYFNLKHLSHYVGAEAQRVYLYTQTLLVDEDIDVPFALFIRTRELIIDTTKAFSIGVLGTVPNLDYDYDHIIEYGVPMDVSTIKHYYMCVRILMDTRRREYINEAYNIGHDILHTGPVDALTNAEISKVRMYLAAVKGVDRADTHIVPFYTNSHISDMLKVYSDQISLYHRQFSRLKEKFNLKEDFLDFAENMNDIYVTTAMTESLGGLDDALTVIRSAELVYARLQTEYDQATFTVSETKNVFLESLEKLKKQNFFESLIMLVKGVGTIVYGIFSEDPKKAIDGVREVVSGIQNFDSTFDTIANMVREMSSFLYGMKQNQERLEDMFVPYDDDGYAYNIEMVAGLHVQVVYWKNLNTNMQLILNDDKVKDVGGARVYAIAIMELCTWGEALTEAMIERAESTRDVMQKRLIVDAKKEQQARTKEVINEAKLDNEKQTALYVTMEAQSQAVAMDLNDALIMFCQAYFFQNLKECKESYKPKFGGTLDVLLTKINQARRDSMFISGVPSSVAREISIVDMNFDPDCYDATQCPINYFRKHRELIYEVPTDHPELRDLNQYRVSELVLTIVGAKKTNEQDHDRLKLIIEASGEFKGQSSGSIYNFLSRPAHHIYEYSITTGTIFVHADVYHPMRDIVQQLTPYCTWYFKVDDLRSGHIDLSAVTEFKVTFKGSFTRPS